MSENMQHTQAELLESSTYTLEEVLDRIYLNADNSNNSQSMRLFEVSVEGCKELFSFLSQIIARAKTMGYSIRPVWVIADISVINYLATIDNELNLNHTRSRNRTFRDIENGLIFIDPAVIRSVGFSMDPETAYNMLADELFQEYVQVAKYVGEEAEGIMADMFETSTIVCMMK